MRLRTTYQNLNLDDFKKKLLIWSSKFEYVAFLDSNNYYQHQNSKFSYHTFDSIVGVGHISLFSPTENSFENLNRFFAETNDWIFGHLGYDLKNEIEDLSSNNIDFLNFPNIFFFQPKYVFIIQNNQLHVEHFKNINPDTVIDEILNQQIHKSENELKKIEILSRFTKDEYIETIDKVKQHIKRGDIYEVNLCQEFFNKNVTISAIDIYSKLITVSPTPFGCFYKISDKYLLSASPERFLKKINNKLISQPIKGTIKRGGSKIEDENLKFALKNDNKELAENIMIVDLVRNDLTRTVLNASVKVEELCEIYSFKQVHQMISTISAEIDNNLALSDIFKNTFPMGSMTGAPKIRAMEIIEKYEKTKRGLYSGAVGYINPKGDFDFNVVIRSIFYNSENNYLSFTVGGAITANSVPENEYNECLLKAKAILEVLG
ncbi:MAG TPA: aminodeoxychorismate synthase component I [Bacteroidales bacterium]|nr:MAG: aminodeoxychorismate synthase component I [Bacteroidetes bacterium GWF2_33_38]OFY71504.1 MAG: aminodeoxychorismate synthase component I [Bacteroidetes bacterium RIFOXYA12_FULL_33_9]HBF87826.1 aminodeoxychorismate synthase component I [Bacteroidales bacterium]